MKKKIIIVVLLLLMTTGCSVNYNIVIEDEKINETTTFTQEENAVYTKSYMYSQYKEEYPIYYDEEFLYYSPTEKLEENTYYEKSIVETDNGYEATYKANYNIDNYQRSRILNTAYEKYSVGYEAEDSYYYLVANNLKIFKNNKDLSSIKVSITLNDYEVIEGNYSTQAGNTYIWNFDRNSKGTINLKYKEKEINNIDNAQSSNSESKKNNKSIIDGTSSYTIYIFCAILIIIILVGYKLFNNLKEKNNGMDD